MWLAQLQGQVVAQLMLTYEYSDWCVSPSLVPPPFNNYNPTSHCMLSNFSLPCCPFQVASWPLAFRHVLHAGSLPRHHVGVRVLHVLENRPWSGQMDEPPEAFTSIAGFLISFLYMPCGRLPGHVGALTEPVVSRRGADYWWIQSVYVLPEHRRQGHYRRMYNHTREAALREGAAGLRLYADINNTGAHETVSLLP